jgi:hypothetical protein
MTQADPASFRRAFAQAQDVRITPDLLRADPLTLLLAGERELRATRASNRLLAEHMRNAVSRMVPGAGHGWIGTAPDLHLATVRAWLAGRLLPPELRPEEISIADQMARFTFGRPVHEDAVR